MIVVLGATGTTGSEVVKALQASRAPFRVMSRDPAKAKQALAGRVEVVAGNLDEPETLPRALAGATRAFFVSAVDERYAERFGTFLTIARAERLQHVVKLSAFQADLASPTALLRQHAATDNALIASGLAFTLLRANGFFQNLLWAAGSIKSQGKIFMPFKNARQSIVDVRDVAAVGALALTRPGHEGQTYELTGPEALTYAEIAAVFARVLGKPVAYVDIPLAAARDGMKRAGMPAWNADEVTRLYELFSTGAAGQTTDTVRHLLGRPATALEAWVRANAVAFK
jgi:uncharacterized protein YbjT (DUF2867 family)